MKKDKEFQKLARSRSEVYGFLSALYLDLPSKGWVSQLLAEDALTPLATLSLLSGVSPEVQEGLKLIQDFLRDSRSKPLEELETVLAVERTRLLRGIRPADSPPPPYESVYRGEEGQLAGLSAVEISRLYASAGVGIPSHYHDLPDYIGLELDFMRFLCRKEAESWGKGGRDEALKHLAMEQSFLAEHLMQWVPRFCSTAYPLASLDFYRGVLKLTQGVIASDLKAVGELIASITGNATEVV